MKFEAAVQEIFAVSILPGIRFPELIEWDEALLSSAFVLPDAALAEVDFTALQAGANDSP